MSMEIKVRVSISRVRRVITWNFTSLVDSQVDDREEILHSD